MFRRWQAALEYLNLLLLLVLPLWLVYSAQTPDMLIGAAWYLLNAVLLAACFSLKAATPAPAPLRGFAWLEQYLLLALLLTLASLFYLPTAPVAAVTNQWLWLQTQLLLPGVLLRLYYRFNPVTGQTTAAPRWLVAYASQSGTALQLAQHSAQQLQRAGIPVALAELNQLTTPTLLQFQKALFVVSTYGEGEPPDNASQFYQLAQHWQHNLQQLEYAVLALGDRSYQQFCAFGHWLNRWLSQHQARSLIPLQEVDSAQTDSPALQQWQQLLRSVSGQPAPARAEPTLHASAAWQQASLHSRYIANPGSSALPCYVVKLRLAADCLWQAGDIVDIQPQNSKCSVTLWLTQHLINGCQSVQYQGKNIPLCWALAELQLDKVQPAPTGQALAEWLAAQPRLPKRSYSIASTPAEGHVMLLVRQVQKADGSLGLGSGWLTAWAMEQQQLQLKIRRNPQFHLPADDVPLIAIASGTGIAGIRALLAERAGRNITQNWLLFGERHSATDFLFARDIQQWQQQGILTQLDTAFSRDSVPKRYVQDALAARQLLLQQWLAKGAAIYVCGSLAMGAAVQQQLMLLLGDEALQMLQQQGRYRRDVY